MILMDGRSLAEKLKTDLKAGFSLLKKKAVLGIIQVGEHPASALFIQQKKKVGEELSAEVRIFRYPADISNTLLRKKIGEIVHNKKISGIVIQLPLPAHINTQDILNAVVSEKDVDMLSARAIGDYVVGKSEMVPPVAGAIFTLLKEYAIEYKGKTIVIVGAGRLVGQPMALSLLRENVGFSVCTDATPDLASHLKTADVIISGVGKTRLITGDMIKVGAVCIDAGSSEDTGKISGDMETKSVSEKAGFLTPVPGGVGPLTVVMVFNNLYKKLKNI